MKKPSLPLAQHTASPPKKLVPPKWLSFYGSTLLPIFIALFSLLLFFLILYTELVLLAILSALVAALFILHYLEIRKRRKEPSQFTLKEGTSKTNRHEFSQRLGERPVPNGWLRFFVLWRLPVSIVGLAILILSIFLYTAFILIDGEFNLLHGVILAGSIPNLALLVLLCVSYVHMKNLSPKGYKLAIVLTIAEPLLNLIAVLLNPAFYEQVLFVGSLALFAINLPYFEKRRSLFVYAPQTAPTLPDASDHQQVQRPRRSDNVLYNNKRKR